MTQLVYCLRLVWYQSYRTSSGSTERICYSCVAQFLFSHSPSKAQEPRKRTGAPPPPAGLCVVVPLWFRNRHSKPFRNLIYLDCVVYRKESDERDLIKRAAWKCLGESECRHAPRFQRWSVQTHVVQYASSSGSYCLQWPIL